MLAPPAWAAALLAACLLQGLCGVATAYKSGDLLFVKQQLGEDAVTQKTFPASLTVRPGSVVPRQRSSRTCAHPAVGSRHAADRVFRSCSSVAVSIICIRTSRPDGVRKGSQAAMQQRRMACTSEDGCSADALPLLPCAGVLTDREGPWLRRPQQVRRQGSTAPDRSIGAIPHVPASKRLDFCGGPYW